MTNLIIVLLLYKGNYNNLILTPKSRDDGVLDDVHSAKRSKDTTCHGIIFNTDGNSPFKSYAVTV